MTVGCVLFCTHIIIIIYTTNKQYQTKYIIKIKIWKNNKLKSCMADRWKCLRGGRRIGKYTNSLFVHYYYSKLENIYMYVYRTWRRLLKAQKLKSFCSSFCCMELISLLRIPRKQKVVCYAQIVDFNNEE